MQADRHAPSPRRAAALYPLLYLLPAALLLNLFIESLARLSPLGGISFLFNRPGAFWLNIAVLLATLSLSLLFQRRFFALFLIGFLWIVLGVTNAVLMLMRASPLSGMDFSILRSCLPILKVYLRPKFLILILSGLGAAAALIVLLYRRSKRYEVSLRGGILPFLLALLLLAGSWCLSVEAGAFDAPEADLSDSYDRYGFVTCFSMSVLNRGIEKPEAYTPASVASIASRLALREEEELDFGINESQFPLGNEEGDFSRTAGKKPPNVVVVQLESFMDPERLAGFTYSESPAPVFRSLKERFPSGRLHVSSIGGGTANTEFEVLTGIDLSFFGMGEYPYESVLEEEDAVCESMASDLRAAGYRTHALHNHSGSFYSRYKVYAALGFDDFTPLEYMNGVECNSLGWAKDAVLLPYIEKCLDATDEADFCFAVSVQGHGLYPKKDDGSGKIRLSYSASDGGDAPAPSEKELAAFTYYINQIREMDECLLSLVELLEERAERTGEETLLLLYGDHLPALPFSEASFTDGSDAFDSEYVLVPVGSRAYEASLDGVGDRDLDAWEAGMLTLRMAGCGEGLLNRCHRMMNPPDGEGVAVGLSQPPSIVISSLPDSLYAHANDFPPPLFSVRHETKQLPFRTVLRTLAYDMLYGERYAWEGRAPFEKKPLRLGVDEIVLSSATVTPTPGLVRDALITVRGENFTPYSVITVNGRAIRTEFVSPELLTGSGAAEAGDEIAVIQRSEDLVVLGKCDNRERVETAARENELK